MGYAEYYSINMSEISNNDSSDHESSSCEHQDNGRLPREANNYSTGNELSKSQNLKALPQETKTEPFNTEEQNFQSKTNKPCLQNHESTCHQHTRFQNNFAMNQGQNNKPTYQKLASHDGELRRRLNLCTNSSPKCESCGHDPIEYEPCESVPRKNDLQGCIPSYHVFSGDKYCYDGGLRRRLNLCPKFDSRKDSSPKYEPCDNFPRKFDEGEVASIIGPCNRQDPFSLPCSPCYEIRNTGCLRHSERLISKSNHSPCKRRLNPGTACQNQRQSSTSRGRQHKCKRDIGIQHETKKSSSQRCPPKYCVLDVHSCHCVLKIPGPF